MMTLSKYSMLLLGAIAFSSCTNTPTPSSEKNIVDLQHQYSDVLNIKHVPQSTEDLDAFGFSDQGAWHAFSLAPNDSSQYNGAFMGPLLMKMSGQWIGKNLFQLQIKVNGEKIDLSNAKANNTYFPGRLEQKLILPSLEIKRTLVFANNRTSLIHTEIQNKRNKDLSILLGWKGSFFREEVKISKSDKGLTILPSDEDQQIQFTTPFDLELTQDQNRYEAWSNREITIAANKSQELSTSQSMIFKGEKSPEMNGTIESIFADNTSRWNQYISKIIKIDSDFDDVAHKRMAVKAGITLISNWRSAAGALKHDGIFPSAAYQGFYGFWSWDSWKYAVALAPIAPELAESTVLSMFDYQREDGMVPDCIYWDPKDNNWRDTKSPLSTWAVWSIYESNHDKRFLEEMYPKLVKYHQWWYIDRDHNKNGLCEFGATDGTLVAAKWESGMDNAVRFDDLKMLKNHDGAWSLSIESVDLNAYLIYEKELLAKIANVLNKENDAAQYTQEAKALRPKLRYKFYNQKDGFFHDYRLEDNTLIAALGPEGWTPMWTGVASKEEAAGVAKILMDTTEFNTFVPFPTLQASHPKLDPLDGYWRGPVWLDQANFAISGLYKYGYDKEALELTNKLFNNAEGLLGDMPIRETYHPISGKGLDAKNFSWSSAHVLMMLRKE